jgi:hypothetical protein
MIFSFAGTTGHGSSYCEDNFIDKSWYNENCLKCKKQFTPRLSMYLINKSELITDLELHWRFTIYSGGVQVYDLHASQKFYVSELNKPFAEDDLKSIIALAHTHLRLSFEEKREEHNLFKPISNITEEELQTAVLQLVEVIYES